jgi:hypothetical protein
MNLEVFIANHADRWANALAHAKDRRPWIRHLGNGLYRVARRPTDRDRGFRIHFVQFSLAGDRILASCDCEGFFFGKCCVHIAACYRLTVKRALRKAA